MSVKPTSVTLECPQHLWLRLSGHPSYGGHTEAALGVQGWPLGASAALQAPVSSCETSQQPLIDREACGSYCWLCFPGLGSVTPQRGISEDPVVSRACLVPPGTGWWICPFFSLFHICEEPPGVVVNARSLRGKR